MLLKYFMLRLDRFMKSLDHVVISRMIRWKLGEEPVITVAKRLVSPYTLRPVGMIITDVNYKRIQEIAKKVTIGRTGHMYILDSQGHYVYHPDLDEIGKPSPYSKQIDNAESGSFLSEDGKDFLTYSSSNSLGWTLVTSVPYRELTQGSSYIGVTILITASITLVAASSLARLLRYNLKSDSLTVSVQEEIAFCKVYLRIQKFRFDDKFEYEFHIPDWTMKQSIAKFSLQPMVENCVIHAIEMGMQRVRLRVTVQREGAAFRIVLSDNGAGISPETLQRIENDLKQKDVLSGGPSIGIVNVHKRITYIYGEEFGISIASRLNSGTTVAVRLPYQTGAEDELGGS